MGDVSTLHGKRFNAVELSIAGGAATTDTETIDFGTVHANRLVRLHGVAASYATSGGSAAATFDIRIGEVSGWTNGARTERFTSTGNAVGTVFRSYPDPPRWFRCDANGRLYLRGVLNVAPGALITDTITVDLDFETIRG